MKSTKFIEKLTFQGIAELILNAKSEVVFSSINIHKEVAIPLTEVSQKGIKMRIIIDTDEGNYRNGYGEINNIDLLRNIGVEIFEVKGNTISFLIIDDNGYFIFPQSLIFKSDATGPNSILMDNAIKLKLLAHYFPPKSKKEKDELINKVIEVQNNSKQAADTLIKEIETEKTKILI